MAMLNSMPLGRLLEAGLEHETRFVRLNPRANPGLRRRTADGKGKRNAAG
jgi:hypothetical protein